MELTKLQRLGISSLLIQYRYHGNAWLRSGTISFTKNEHGKYISMWVTSNERDIRLNFTLELSENIDLSISYYFEYDNEYDMFRIYELGGEA